MIARGKKETRKSKWEGEEDDEEEGKGTIP